MLTWEANHPAIRFRGFVIFFPRVLTAVTGVRDPTLFYYLIV